MPSSIVAAGVLALLAAVPAPLLAQSSSSPSSPAVSVSGYLQTQYERIERTDRVFFRRMVVTLEATPFDHWVIAIQADLAPVASGERLTVKDAYLRYTGWDDRGVTITLGNQKTPFSRSLLQSSSRRGFVERPFTGDRSLGAPGRALSARADVWTASERVYIGTAIASSLHAPPADEIQIDGLPEAGDDWNEGVLGSGRVEWHPLGKMSSVHGAWDEDKSLRVMLGAAAYAWRNDNDRNQHGAARGDAADAGSVNAIEFGGGVRAGRLSLDAEWQRLTSATTNPNFSGGLYAKGRATVRKAAVEGGWMLYPDRLEVVAAADVADAGTFAAPWQRGAIGVNWYVHGHDLKFQFTHRLSSNVEGVRGATSRATHVQAQIAF